MLEVLLDWRGDDVVDEARLANDLGELAFDFADMQLKDLKVGVLLHRVAAVLREHAIVMPADLALLFKALISLEGLGGQYGPEFRLLDRIQPFIARAMSERYQPAEVVRRGQATLGDFISLLTSMPRDLARLIKDARHGCMRVDLDLKRLDSLSDRRDNPKRPRQLSALAGLSFVLRWRGPTGRGGPFEQAGNRELRSSDESWTSTSQTSSSILLYGAILNRYAR